MSSFLSLLQEVNPGAPIPVPSPAQPSRTSTPTQRPAISNGSTAAPPLKRKAEGQQDGAEPKVPRRDGSLPVDRMNGTVRPAAAPIVAKSKPTPQSNNIPYRGTAGLARQTPAQGANNAVKKAVAAPTTARPSLKPITPTTATAPSSKSTTPTTAAKPSVGTTSGSGAEVGKPKLGSYAAMLAKAKEQQAKAVVPTVKHEPTKISYRQERQAALAAAKLKTKGKTAGTNGPSRAGSIKGADPIKEKRKPVEVSYQGTARPKQRVELSYKGTARPSSGAVGTVSRKTGSVSVAAKASRGKYNGYVSWDELDEEEEEEEDYDSDASSAMEAGIWAQEEEDRKALAAAKKEDAEALAEEERLRRQKQARLAKMNREAALKKKR
ncbi:hypothetical protein GQ43DRAFT_462900 [Delitschia confertaspora ATCC 74209]|uniref:SPT2 chromatin protein n=1 Tax=Delitschia confertaspora ATCC 74209 TaxID=1513339 RepID=A0A9P4JME5_9PLEO|nr:hypothetical protein GQ43DRAFT_462900 [Delitschia confertaspora ATCC 74209]